MLAAASDGGPIDEAKERKYVTTYRWLDSYGRPRSVDVFTEPTSSRRVWAYATGAGGNPVLVATMSADGKFARLTRDEAIGYGLDTAAAWNNLIELCRFAHSTGSVY